jgi:hypothetical protein
MPLLDLVERLPAALQRKGNVEGQPVRPFGVVQRE